jgi:hypothetical protein
MTINAQLTATKDLTTCQRIGNFIEIQSHTMSGFPYSGVESQSFEDDCESRSFLPERIFVLPQGEPHLQQATEYRPDTLVDVHTGRGRPRSHARM